MKTLDEAVKKILDEPCFGGLANEVLGEGHWVVLAYNRPWYKFFRKQHMVACAACLKVVPYDNA